MATVINSIIDKQLESIPDGGQAEVSVHRRKAMVFAEEGKIDHEGKYSIYGQIIQGMKAQGYASDLNNFRHRDVDGRIYRINFKGEGSIDAGGPFRDSLTNII